MRGGGIVPPLIPREYARSNAHNARIGLQRKDLGRASFYDHARLEMLIFCLVVALPPCQPVLSLAQFNPCGVHRLGFARIAL
jgi:hypothetical protein